MLLSMFVVMILVIAFPQLALWLPAKMGYCTLSGFAASLSSGGDDTSAAGGPCAVSAEMGRAYSMCNASNKQSIFRF
jgi:hypothetical protein